MRRKISSPRGWENSHLPDTAPGERLKKCRVAKNLTQVRLSVLVDISPTTISKLERGETFFSAEDAEIFAEALETTSEYLLYGAPKNEGETPTAKDGQTVFVAVTQDGGNISVAVFRSSEDALRWVESEQKDHGRCRVFAETVY